MKTGQKRLHDQIAALCNDLGAIQAQDFAGTTLDALRLMMTTRMSLSLIPVLHARSDELRGKLIVVLPLVRGASVRELMMTWRNSSPRPEAHCRLAKIIEGCLLPWAYAEGDKSTCRLGRAKMCHYRAARFRNRPT